MSALKIVVTGPVCAGKTTFVRALAESTPISTEERERSLTGTSETTVALDFARATVAGQAVKLFGTPGQERFGYMREELAHGADGIVLLTPMDRDASLRKGLTFLHQMTPEMLPLVVVGLTRTDCAGADLPAELEEPLASIAVHVDRIDAREPEQCRRLVATLIEAM